jgi:type II secretion system protein H
VRIARKARPASSRGHGSIAPAAGQIRRIEPRSAGHTTVGTRFERWHGRCVVEHRHDTHSKEERTMKGGLAAPAARDAGAGFTLVELAIVLVIFGIVSAIAIPGINKFLRSVEMNGEVQQFATTMRVVRQRAITENNNYVLYWDATDRKLKWWDDDNNNGVQDGPEKFGETSAMANWITVTNSSTNPFPSDTVLFVPNGSASVSGSVIYSNPEGYSRSLSVVRPTGMVTVQ